MRKALYPKDRYHHGHPDVAISLNNLAIDLRQLGDYEGARALDERALAMRERLYGGDHPRVAVSLSNLAIDLRQLDEPERARELDEQALAMRQRLSRTSNQ